MRRRPNNDEVLRLEWFSQVIDEARQERPALTQAWPLVRFSAGR
jgi:hypothetical protein